MIEPLRVGGVIFEPHAYQVPGRGVTLRTDGRTGRVCIVFGAEQARELAAWLTAAVGDAPGPADADAVRAAIDEQRRILAGRSAAAVTTEEARAELAWADHALDAIAAAAGAPTERTTR